jgi:2-methylcitrate dehydratase PrpD
MQEPAVLRQRGKVRLAGDEALARLLPVRVAVVELTLSDGAYLTERVEAVRGTPRNPMTRIEIIEKCRGLVAPVIGTDKFNHLSEAIFALDSLADVRTLRPFLQRSKA